MERAPPLGRAGDPGRKAVAERFVASRPVPTMRRVLRGARCCAVATARRLGPAVNPPPVGPRLAPMPEVDHLVRLIPLTTPVTKETSMRVLAIGWLLGTSAAALHAQEVDWTANGRDAQGTRYTPASHITRANVGGLALAWTYRTGETEPRVKTDKATAFEATPLVVDGTMYVGTPLGRVIALDPATGHERWVFDPKIRRDVTYGDFASRGVSTWLDASAPAGATCRRRIFVATAQSQLFALDARDGRPCAGFGRDGMVALTAGLRIPPFEPGAYSMTSPPLAVNGLVITGSSVADNSRPNPASGEVRAYDARTGALK